MRSPTVMRDPNSQKAYERMLDHMARRHQAAKRWCVFRMAGGAIVRSIPKACYQIAIALVFVLALVALSVAIVVFCYPWK